MANNEDIAKSIANALQASPAKTSTPTGVMTESLKATKLAEEVQAQSAAEDAAFMEERRKRQQAEVISGTTALPDLAGGSQAASSVKRKPYVDLGEPAPAFGSAAGVGYDAIRDDSISPAQQLDSGAVISDSPNAYPHMGGIVSPGREIYAELPKAEDTFYLKAKYRPITPKPIRMFDGSEFTTNTANMQKAMYQFIVGVKGVKDLDWAGYRMLGPKQEESWTQGFFRSIANSVPQMVVGMAHGTVSLGNDIANVIDLMFHDDKYSKQINAIYNANAAAINEAANDLYQSLRIDYTDITERDTKKPAVMAGNLAGSVVPAILGGPNTLAALALSEGLSGYAGIRNSLRDAGYSPAEAFGMALGGGLAIGGLSYASDWFVDDVQKVLTKSGTSLIKEALYNPKGLAKVVRNVGFKKSLMEAGSEVMQEDVQRLFSGESFSEVYTSQWDERLNVAVGSLLFGLGAAYYQSVKIPAQGERIKKYLESVETLLASNRNVFEQFINEGIITEESVDAIFAALRNPEAGAAVADIIKDTVIQQFDKIPAEQIQKLQKVLDGIDPNLELDKEFGKLNERVDALLANSNLSAEQKNTVRNFMRGVAAWQLSTMGVLPSQMQLPQSITSERPKGVPASAAGWTSPDGSVIYISTGNTAPLSATQITAGRGSGNLAASRKVGSDISKAASKGAGNLSQSIDVGLTKHELTHWAEKFTGLKNVAEFANAMSKLVSTIIPNYTKGKSGVELSEAFAYAMQYAGNQAKEAIGLVGPVQDHVNFINSMLRANQSAGRITAELKAYFDVLQKVLTTNSQLIDQVLEEWKSPEALRSAIREFIETGDASVLSVDTLRNLSAVLNSVVNGETQDKLATVFESGEQMQEFKDTANGIKTKQSEKDRVEKQDMLAGIRKEANVQVGLPENMKPTAAPTMTEAVSEIATEDVELPKAETKTEAKAEAKTETKAEEDGNEDGKPAIRYTTDGKPYYVDWTRAGEIPNAELVKYRIYVRDWLGELLASGNAKETQLKAVRSYNELAAAEVAKRKKARAFTTEQIQALEDEGLYAVMESADTFVDAVAASSAYYHERHPGLAQLEEKFAAENYDSSSVATSIEDSLVRQKWRQGLRSEGFSDSEISSMEAIAKAKEQAEIAEKSVEEWTKFSKELSNPDDVSLAKAKIQQLMHAAVLMNSNYLHLLREDGAAGWAQNSEYEQDKAVYEYDPFAGYDYDYGRVGEDITWSDIHHVVQEIGWDYAASDAESLKGARLVKEAQIASERRRNAEKVVSNNEEYLAAQKEDLSPEAQEYFSDKIKHYQSLLPDLVAAEQRADNEVKSFFSDFPVNVGLYAVFEAQPLYTEQITNALAEIVVEERTPAEQDLYRALAQYEADSNFYKDYEFVSQYEANTRLISLAEELDAKISLISADPKSRARSYINTLEKRIASHIQFLEDQNHDILMNEMLVADGILEPDYAGTTDDRTRAEKQYDKEIGIAEAIESEAKGFKEASMAKLESLKNTVADLKVAMSRGPKIAKKRVDAALASLNTELLGEANPAMIDIYTKVLDFANRLQESNSSGRLPSVIASLEKEIRNIERSLKDEGSVYRFYDATAKAERIRQGAERRLESAKKAPRRSTSRLTPYFTPKYDSDLSVHVAGVRTLDSAYAFLRGGKGTEEDRAGAQRVIQENRVLASHASPARAFGRRPLLDTPSPLEERGISVEEALQTIANAGLKPYELDVSQITNDFIGKSYNLEGEAPKTRSRIYAKLIDFMLHEDFGMKDIAESGDDAQMMRVLLAIHEAKYLANDMFAQYLGREQSFDKHPSLHPISPATIEFAKSERGQAQMKDHKQNRGYSEVALSHMLEEGDHVAFPYGNNYFRGIISFKGKTPSGATTYVIRRDIDVAEWKDKELTPKTRGLEEYVIGAEEFYKVGILRKPVRSIDAGHIKEVFDFYDNAFEKTGRVNWTQRGIMSRINEDADIFDAIDPIKREIAEELSALDSPTDGLFAIAPTIDPGAFAVIGGSLEDTMAAYERSMELEDEYAESGLWYEGKAEQEAILAAELARREDQLKPRFSDAVTKKNERGVSFLDQLDMLEKGLADTRVSKVLYFLGSGSGTDRKGRLLFGKVWDRAFGLSRAYSYAQQRREMRVHLMDEVVVKDVFGGNQKAYDKWRAEIKADRYDAVVNGDKVKISRDEIMSIYAMKLASERPGSSNNQLSRLRKYSNIDGLIANLTAEDKKFVEKAVVEIRAAREGISSVPTDWVPAVEMTTFRKDGWAGRKKSKINNERSFVESDTSIAALGLYDSTISSISRFATHASGLMAQLDNLKQILAFAGIDKSMYREFDTLGEDQKLYDEILDRSTKLREAIAKKIGHTQAKWLLQGIEYDLTADPLSDDIGTAPGMEWFQKLTRGAASSAMSLNLRQALQNLGNYHRFFGLSSSGGVKFYTADWINAVAHIKEAWALAMENPEFKRRFEQAGLSEHMRRIADVNQPSFLGEIQTKLYEKGKDGASDLVGTLNSLSAIGTKWGLATNVLPDMVGIALGNYAVWNDVLAKNGGNVAQAQKEIADFVNNRISSSNYMTQSLLKKRLNKMGLGALVMFQSDQLQSFGALAEAWSTLLNSKDANERSVAKRDIASFVVSMGRYIAIKAGWVGVLMATAMGRDLSDDEWEYIYESTAYEMVAQMGGWSQFNNLGISPFIRSLMEGENFGPSIVTVSATGRLISGVRKGFKGDGMSFVDALGEALALSGIAPAFPALLRISDGIFKLASGDEHEQAVGAKQVLGTSETGAMQQLGLSKSKKTGKIQPKKKLKKDGE